MSDGRMFLILLLPFNLMILNYLFFFFNGGDFKLSLPSMVKKRKECLCLMFGFVNLSCPVELI